MSAKARQAVLPNGSNLVASNPHGERKFESHRGMRRGGLSNTCPQADVVRRPLLLAGQMSDKPKR